MITITWVAEHVARIEVNTILTMTVITIIFQNETINIAQETNKNKN